MASAALRRRAAPNRETRAVRASAPMASLPFRPSHGRDTRHASIRNYAEPSETDEDEGEDEDDYESESGEDDNDDGDDDVKADELGYINFPPQRLRRSKRPRPASTYAADNSPSKRRRQPPRGASQARDEDKIYLSPTSDDASRRRQTRQAAAASTVSSSPRTRRSNRERPENTRERRTPTKAGKHMAVITDEKRYARKGDSVGMRPTAAAKAAKAANVKLPPWETLPYLILAHIFACAAAPLDNISSVRWLAAASRTCRAFAEPALRTLYECPPMLTMNMAHSLVDLLAQPPATTMFDYRQKVKALHIDVGSLASRVYKGRHLDIAGMVSHCPRLAELDLYHYKDKPPYRELTENLKWTYPRSLFEALGAMQPEQNDLPDGQQDEQRADEQERGNAADAPSVVIKLKSWRWNQRMMGRDLTLDNIRTLHLTPTFAGLRKISFVNYQRPSLDAKDADDPQVVAEDEKQAQLFASLLAALPNLTHLVMESSTVANHYLLPLLPKTLTHLELISCWDVTADLFTEYLVTHGQQLRHLTLHYDQSLSLGFLPVLGSACPDLATLRMNLTYYSHHTFYNDSNPMYAHLLTEDQVPTWPPAIQRIELEHLRKWEPAAAEVFFQSLVDSAPRVPHLRILAIKAMLDIPWRQRCEMRDRWEAELTRVFLRHSPPPLPASSLQYYQQQRKEKEAAAVNSSPRPAKNKSTGRDRDDAEPQRRSHRLHESAGHASSSRTAVARGLRKKAPGDRVSYREPDTDEDMGLSDEYDEDDDDDDDDDEQERSTRAEEADESNTDDEDVVEGGDRRRKPSAAGQDEGEFAKGRRRQRLFVQGMCDVVDIRIDNQKPGEIQYRMDDFLDSDTNSDEEWTGDGAEANDYAW